MRVFRGTGGRCITYRALHMDQLSIGVLGHTSDKMARHYAGEARKAAAAEVMAKHSLAC